MSLRKLGEELERATRQEGFLDSVKGMLGMGDKVDGSKGKPVDRAKAQKTNALSNKLIAAKKKVDDIESRNDDGDEGDNAATGRWFSELSAAYQEYAKVLDEVGRMHASGNWVTAAGDFEQEETR